MLEFVGRPIRRCDGWTRRAFLKVGSLALGGLTLAEMLARKSRGAPGGSHPNTSVIFIELNGGPSQFETYDPKPNAPVEYRGPLGTVATNVPGVYFSELMPRQAAVMDKLAIVRSLYHESASHDTSSHMIHTGYFLQNLQGSENEMPSIGSITARARGSRATGMPAYVSMSHSIWDYAAWLGKAYNPFLVDADPAAANFEVRNLTIDRRLPAGCLENRRRLLAEFDRMHTLADNAGISGAMDQFNARAFEMLTSQRAREAFDLNAEPAKTRDAYGRTTFGQGVLLARRLVEAGVTFVTIRPGNWDHHGQLLKESHKECPPLDQGITALVRDLHERGLDRDVLVVAMGEFGRTPLVNALAGRDHWPLVMSALVAGGGLPMGQVIGSSSSKGEVPADRPYRPENMLATIYRHLGIDPAATFPDLNGRPRYILEERDVIRELV